MSRGRHSRCHAYTVKKRRCRHLHAANTKYCATHRQLYRLEKPSECPVCMEALPEQLRPTKCGHYLHKHCLDQWLVNNTTCPVCRTQLGCVSSQPPPPHPTHPSRINLDELTLDGRQLWEVVLANIERMISDIQALRSESN